MSQWSHVEDNDENGEYANSRTQTNDDADQFPASIKSAKGNVGHKGKSQHEAKQKSKKMRPVVEPREEA